MLESPSYLPRMRRAATLMIILATVLPSTARASGPPDNDNFANASTISSVPFATSGDLTDATTEPNEPISSCDRDGSAFPSIESRHTAWYRLDVSSPQRIDVLPDGGYVVATIYAGDSVENLRELGCTANWAQYSNGNLVPLRGWVGTGSTLFLQVDVLHVFQPVEPEPGFAGTFTLSITDHQTDSTRYSSDAGTEHQAANGWPSDNVLGFGDTTANVTVIDDVSGPVGACASLGKNQYYYGESCAPGLSLPGDPLSSFCGHGTAVVSKGVAQVIHVWIGPRYAPLACVVPKPVFSGTVTVSFHGPPGT